MKGSLMKLKHVSTFLGEGQCVTFKMDSLPNNCMIKPNSST